MNEKKLDFNELTGIAALLIHAAKIDDNYTNKEKNLISFLKSFIENEEKNPKNLQKMLKISKKARTS